MLRALQKPNKMGKDALPHVIFELLIVLEALLELFIHLELHTPRVCN
jgi:hypothetical protein